MKVLVVGHGCSPSHGSEPSFTFNWAWHLSACHEVWVLAHPHRRDAVESFLAANPNPAVRFIWVTPPRFLDPWDPAKGEVGLPLHYLLWQRAAFRRARQLLQSIRFDLCHHVSAGTVSAAPPLWRLPIPFVWGPVGGGQISPAAFRHYFGAAGWAKEMIRTLRVRLAPRRPSIRQAASRSALVLSTNHETARALEGAGAKAVLPFLDSGLTSDFFPAQPVRREQRNQITILWVGRLEARKALPLGLEALARLGPLPVQLLVAGDGPLRSQWEKCAVDLGLDDRVHFLGRVPWDRMPDLYRGSDIFLFTSLRDSFGTQVLEAMGHSLPVVTLDHQGVGAFLPDRAGFKVPVTQPETTVNGLAEAIRTLACSYELRTAMGEAGRAFAATQTWEKRAEHMSVLYEEIFSRAPLTSASLSSVSADTA
jgi:glycosyltransferase involved in cell wall biosynthesis